MVKELEGDAQTLLSKLHHYHTHSNVAKHEVVVLTTYITNLIPTDSWKGTTRQLLSHFKEKLRLLESLVPDTDKVPETVRITFFQRAVQQNHDLRQIHVLDSVWRCKTGPTGKLTFEVYYDLLWNAGYQHDLNKATKQPQIKAFISHQNDPSDNLKYDHDEENSTDDQDQDDPSPYSAYQSSSSNHTGPKRATKTDIHPQPWKQLPESVKQMVFDHSKKINPKSFSHGGKPKPKPILGKPNPNPQQVHLHEKDDFIPEETPDNPTQAMVHECLAACDTDASDIQNVMSVFNTKSGTTSPESPRQVQVHQMYVFTRANQSTIT